MIFNVSKLATFLLCFSTFSIFAQAVTIITNKNDTISGLIDYQEVLTTPKRITFRATEKSEKQYFYPSQIKEFSVKSENQIYESALVKINSEKYKFEGSRIYNTVQEAIKDIRWRQDTLFLLTLAKGKINLYEFVDEFGENHYIIKKDNGDYETLLNFKFRLSLDNMDRVSNVETQVEEYKNQLKAFFSDCPSLELNPKKIPYNAISILTLVNKYNLCTKNLAYTKPLKLYKSHFYFALGLSKSKIGLIDFFNKKYNFDLSPRPTASIGVEFSRYSNQRIPKFGIAGLELNFLPLKLRDSVEYTFLGSKYNYNLDAFGVNIIPYLQFNFKLGNTPTQKSAFYIKAGPVVTFSPKIKFNDSDYKRINISASINLGFRLNRYFIESRYETKGSNILPSSYNITLNQSRVSLLAGYLF